MKHFRSEHAFEKYRPHLSWRQKVARFFRKKQYNIAPVSQPTHYKSNPFTRPKKEVASSKFKVILLLIILSFWVACLAYIPYFKINKITYSGLENYTEAELREVVYPKYLNKKSWLPLNNYFFVNTDKVAGSLHESFSFETVQVTKIFPNQLDIIVKEKISSVIYDNGKKYFLLDDRGVAIKYLADVEDSEMIKRLVTSTFSLLSATSTTSTPIFTTSTFEHIPNYEKIKKQFGNYPIIYDKRALDINLKQENILPIEHIASAISWHRYLSQDGVEKLKFFVLEDLNAGMAIDTTDSWNIVVQPKSSTEAQIITLKETLSQIKPKEYVDLRFGEKVYWK